MIAPPRAEAVESEAIDTLLDQVAAGRAVDRDRSGGRDVVCGYGVAHHHEHAGAIDICERFRLGREAVEVWRLLHVGRFRIPREDRSRWRFHRLPVLVAFEDARVLAPEHLLLDAALDDLVHLVLRRPEIREHHRFAVGGLPERILGQVLVHGPGKRERHDQGRRPEVARLDERMDARLEVAVAGQHRDHAQVFLADRGFDLWARQRSRVADAGRASVADQKEPELLERLEQVRGLQIIGDDS